MISPESIYYLFEAGSERTQEDYLWPVAGKATGADRLFIVCDGSGSVSNGGIASKLIGEFMAAKVSKFSEEKMSVDLINRIILEARDRLITYAREYRLDTDLATTFAMIILYDQKVLMAWYGDSPIYHLRGGEILFKTSDQPIVRVSGKYDMHPRGIKADSTPIDAEIKWIEDVREGDYFLICSKSIAEGVRDEDIQRLVGQSDSEHNDPTRSFSRLAAENSTDNYSMYLLKLHADTKTTGINNEVFEERKQTGRSWWPVTVLAVTIVGLLMIYLYFRKPRIENTGPKNGNITAQPVYVPHDDTVPNAIVMIAPRYKNSEVKQKDSIAAVPVVLAPTKPVAPKTDSVKHAVTQTTVVPKVDHPAVLPPEPVEKPAIKQITGSDIKRPAQMLIKFSTDESCKLTITNIDLDEVVNWDLAQNDNGNIYLKPGKYSIVATSVANNSKTKTFHFDVKPGQTYAAQNLRISF